MKVKVCGITNIEDAMEAVKDGADALGFIFADSQRRIERCAAAEIIRKIPPFVSMAGVFVNEDPDTVRETAQYCGLDWVQLHGEESPQYCRDLGLKVIKVFKGDIEKIPAYDVPAVLIDVKEPGWNTALRAKAYNKPVILAGGLTPENVRDAVCIASPYAVDVSSGIEKSPGKKDYPKMRKFIEHARRQGEN